MQRTVENVVLILGILVSSNIFGVPFLLEKRVTDIKGQLVLLQGVFKQKVNQKRPRVVGDRGARDYGLLSEQCIYRECKLLLPCKLLLLHVI